jgi:four helix bundle protein
MAAFAILSKRVRLDNRGTSFEGSSMAFAHAKLTVYQKSIQVVGAVAVLARRIQKIDPWLASQTRRAAASIALNIAEGAGEYSKADKARFYRFARRSAFELSAAFDVATHYSYLGNTEVGPLNALLDEIGAMLTTMVKNLSGGSMMAVTTGPATLPPRHRHRTRPRDRK